MSKLYLKKADVDRTQLCVVEQNYDIILNCQPFNRFVALTKPSYFCKPKNLTDLYINNRKMDKNEYDIVYQFGKKSTKTPMKISLKDVAETDKKSSEKGQIISKKSITQYYKNNMKKKTTIPPSRIPKCIEIRYPQNVVKEKKNKVSPNSSVRNSEKRKTEANCKKNHTHENKDKEQSIKIVKCKTSHVLGGILDKCIKKSPTKINIRANITPNDKSLTNKKNKNIPELKNKKIIKNISNNQKEIVSFSKPSIESCGRSIFKDDYNLDNTFSQTSSLQSRIKCINISNNEEYVDNSIRCVHMQSPKSKSFKENKNRITSKNGLVMDLLLEKSLGKKSNLTDKASTSTLTLKKEMGISETLSHRLLLEKISAIDERSNNSAQLLQNMNNKLSQIIDTLGHIKYKNTFIENNFDFEKASRTSGFVYDIPKHCESGATSINSMNCSTDYFSKENIEREVENLSRSQKNNDLNEMIGHIGENLKSKSQSYDRNKKEYGTEIRNEDEFPPCIPKRFCWT